jgi:nucleotide-binding universal stress UspA family protein
VSVGYRHLLVAYEGSARGDETVRAADAMARRSGTRLTVVVVVELERPSRFLTRFPRQTAVWNDVLLDAARADLDRAARQLEVPAEMTVLFGSAAQALADGAAEFDCDAIMLPAGPRGPLGRLLAGRRAAAVRRRTSCAVLLPG